MSKLQCKWKGKAIQPSLKWLALIFYWNWLIRQGRKQICSAVLQATCFHKIHTVITHIHVIRAHTQRQYHHFSFSSSQSQRMIHKIPRNDKTYSFSELPKSCKNYSGDSSPLALAILSAQEQGHLPGSCSCSLQRNKCFNWWQLW